MEKLEEYVQKSQFSDILRVNFDQKCLRGQKCLLMRLTENVIKYNRVVGQETFLAKYF